MKVCRACRQRFEPKRPLQLVCSLPCAKEWAVTDAARRAAQAARRREVREHRQDNETPAQAAAKAQTVFNRWVRSRDAGLPCISCGHPDNQTRQRHASHYRPAGPNPALRFHPANVHASCSICNNHKSGNLIGYRIGLIARIGLAEVEWLEGPHELPHRTREDCRAIAAHYAEALRNQRRAA